MESVIALEKRLRTAWSSRTASTWTEKNPARGQCSVTSLVVQDLLGGSILKTRVGLQWHFYNSVGGRRLDLTASQFKEAIVYDDLPGSRDEALSDTSIEQYEALRSGLELPTWATWRCPLPTHCGH
ncbi:YunG family protein [Sphingomonas kaistensis]|uniref:YunG family protein n=1 Tax=Sphingomonas kaistensis TaxID=298708 RepID=UPI003CC8758C